MSVSPTLQLDLDKAILAANSATRRLAVLFEWGECSVELFIPRGVDSQSIHDQDELYFVVSGSGILQREQDMVEFSPGDMLFVPAGTEHRFVSFAGDFKSWAVLFGPVGGAAPRAQETA